jgi:hypothetical protein
MAIRGNHLKLSPTSQSQDLKQVKTPVHPAGHPELFPAVQLQNLNQARELSPAGQPGSQLQMQVPQPAGATKEAKKNPLQRAANPKIRTKVLLPAGNN